MDNFMIVAVVLAVVAAAGWYVYKAKKSGKKCIGCPDSGSCGGNCGNCSCGCGK